MTEIPLSSLSARDLAYVGDAVYELAVRESMVLRPGTPDDHHRETVRLVRARAQAELLHRLEPMLSQEEKEVVRWARNARGGPVPRGIKPAEYHASTALEALLGHLYLGGDSERLHEILHLLLQEGKTPLREGEVPPRGDRARPRDGGTPP